MAAENVRIVVVVSDAHPELARDLAGIPPRLRAERIRLLATLGLGVLKGGRVSENTQATSDIHNKSGPVEQVIQKSARALGKLF